MSSKRTRPQQQTQQAHAEPVSTSSSTPPVTASTSAADVTAVALLPSSKRRRLKEGQTTVDGQQREDEETKHAEASGSHEERKSSDGATAGTDRASSAADDDAATAAPSIKPKSKGRKATSPFARCDVDSLSVVLSFLSSDGFLSAIRANKQIHAARLKKSAWPALQLDSFIQSLRDDDYDNPARRRLRLRIPSQASADAGESLLASAAAVFGSAASNSSASAWRFVTDVQLYNDDEAQLSQPFVDVLLPELSRLPYLTAINFHRAIVSTAFEQFCVAVAPRLQVLLFESARVAYEVNPLTHFGLLRELRVLVVDVAPPAPALLQLHRLVYLHVKHPLSKWDTVFAVRRLSASHALRSLSFGGEARWVLDALVATAPPSPHWAVPPFLGDDAALVKSVDWSQPVHLTDLSLVASIGEDTLQQCTAIPTLTRLQANVRSPPLGWASRPSPPLPPLVIFTQLQRLRVQLHGTGLLPHLAECRHLRVLELSFQTSDAISAESLCAIVSANAATLEELRFVTDWWGYSLPSAFLNGDAGAAKWSALANCTRLRVLGLPLDRTVTLTPHVLVALAQLPVFQSLELVLSASPSQCRPLEQLLPSVLVSSSWCSVRLFLTETRSLPTLPAAGGLAKLLPPSSATPTAEQDQHHPPSVAALRRLRVFVSRVSHASERCFVLRKTTDDGPLKWQIEY